MVRRFVGEITQVRLNSLNRDPPHIAVGTPQTLAALLPAALRLGMVQTVVLDEADQLLAPHSRKATEHVLKCATRVTDRPQVIMVSATTSLALRKAKQGFLRRGRRGVTEEINMLRHGAAMRVPHRARHLALLLPPGLHPRLRALTRLLAAHPPAAMLIFCASQEAAEQVLVYLASKRVRCAGLLASMKNRERATALRRMRDGRAQVLVATEHASRGLDLPRLSHVVNFDPPRTATSYVHRAGRVGRIGSPEGLVVSFVQGDPVSTSDEDPLSGVSIHSKTDGDLAEMHRIAVPESGVQLMEVARAVGARGGGLRWAVLRGGKLVFSDDGTLLPEEARGLELGAVDVDAEAET